MKLKSIITRFSKYMQKSNDSDCIEWTAYIDSMGYGRIKINKKTTTAHRVSFMIFKGEIPENLCVCHACDNPKCVNPDHLFLGSHTENMRDMIKKGRKPSIVKSKCKRGHEFSLENTKIYGKAKFCKKCDAIRHKEFRKRQKLVKLFNEK